MSERLANVLCVIGTSGRNSATHVVMGQIALVHDVRVYGSLLAIHRHADLAGTAPGFLARLRKT